MVMWSGIHPANDQTIPDRDASEASSDSGSLRGLRRLGVIATVVEAAVGRWARGIASDTSSSSSSSVESFFPGQRLRLKKQRQSTLSVHSEKTDFDAQITIIKARQESRRIPRSFALLVPSANGYNSGPMPTTSLDVVLSHLQSAIKSRRGADSLPSTGFPKQRRPSDPPWFLDVCSPHSADMHALGKLLHLHPLTLEDILQQDPREKFEVFPRLGYYFISFRVPHRRFHAEMSIYTSDSPNADFWESNIYIIVFREGVCAFHFSEMREHIDYVWNRILHPARTDGGHLSADWIAHGILDSVVDSFFPFLDSINIEVARIEDLVHSGGSLDPVYDRGHGGFGNSTSALILDPDFMDEKNYKSETADDSNTVIIDMEMPGSEPEFSSLKHKLTRIWSRWLPSHRKSIDTAGRNYSLRRIATTRRLVTSLTRLLATKSEVLTQLRKRLIGRSGSAPRGVDEEIVIYLGDVQDHILTLQHSLRDSERVLSQSHPLYLSQLRTTAALAKSGNDKALIYLTMVSVGVLCIQTLLGTFSLNITVPANNLETGPYNVFGIVVALATVIMFSYLAVIWRWWRKANKRRRSAL